MEFELIEKSGNEIQRCSPPRQRQLDTFIGKEPWSWSIITKHLKIIWSPLATRKNRTVTLLLITARRGKITNTSELK